MLSQNLRQLRINNKMTQKNLAEKLGVSFGSIAMWESGRRSPDSEMLIKIADLFDVSVDSLLGRHEFGLKVDVNAERDKFTTDTEKLRDVVLHNFHQALSDGTITEDQAQLSLQIFDHTLTVMIESNQKK